MIKKLLLACCLTIACSTLLAQPVINVSLSNNCYSWFASNSATASTSQWASSTSWTVTGSACTQTFGTTGNLANFQFLCCGTQTISVTGYSASIPMWTTSTVVTLGCPPTVTATALSTTTICAGGSATLQANSSGGISYSWSSGLTGQQVVVSPNSTTCYTAFATNSQGCVGQASVGLCVNVLPAPNLVTSGPYSVCAGNSATFTVSGASNYAWSTGQTGTMIVTTPSANTCFSVMGTNSQGCSAMAVECVTVEPIPNV